MTIILGITWMRIRKKYQGILCMTVDFLFQYIGVMLAVMHAFLHPVISIVLANTLMFTGAILFLIGLRRFLSLKLTWWPYVMMVIVFVSTYSIFTFVFQNKAVRLLIFTVMISIIFVQIIRINNKKLDKKHWLFSRAVVVAHMFLLIIHGSRAMMAILIKFGDYQSLEGVEAVFITLSMMAMVYLTFAVIHMIDMKLLFELNASNRYTKQLLIATEKLAVTDNLTGIANRRKIEEQLKQQLDVYETNSVPFGIMMVDVDHFKRFNDQYGHDFGDQVIIAVSHYIKENITNQGSVGRWGGEEFLIILKHADYEKVQQVAEDLRIGIAALTFVRGEINISATVSIGCSLSTDKTSTDQLIKHADLALYQAKEKGRNRVELYPI